MPAKLKAKDIVDAVISELTSKLEKEGFQSYKAKEFIKINGEIVFYISFQLTKNDAYIWYAIYPLCQYHMWFGASLVADRFPESEGVLKTDTEENMSLAISKLDNGLDGVFEFFKERRNIQELEKSISENEKLGPLLVKGICLAAMNKPNDAKIYLEKFAFSGLGLVDDTDGAKDLLSAISSGTHQELLEANKAANIKKLRLKKFLVE